MADKKRAKLVEFTTPVGIAIYPKLNAPDTKYKPEGEYNVKLKLSAEDAQPLIDKATEITKAFFDETKKTLLAGDGKAKAAAKALKYADDNPWRDEVDDEGEPTGNIILNIKMKAKVERPGKPVLLLKPNIFDAGGKQLKAPPQIWGGSQVKVAGAYNPYYTAKLGVGMSLRLSAVQIIELVSGGNRDAGGYGFGATEGYTGEDESSFPGGDTGGGDDTPADDDNF